MGKNSSAPRNQTTTTNQSGTSSVQLPEWMNQGSQDIYNQLLGIAQGFRPRGPSDLTSQAAGIAGGFGDMAPGALAGANDLYNRDRAGGYATEALDRLLAASAGGPGSGIGGVGPGQIRDVDFREFTDYDIGAYMDPYTGQVVDAALSDLDRGAAEQAQIRASALARGGAFGGSRHGVADAVAGGELARARGATSAQLRSDAFNAAAGLIRGDQAGQLSADQGNQGADIAGAQINSQAAQAGAGNYLDTLNSILSGGINLGQFDLARGGALENFGRGGLDATSGLGSYLDALGRQDDLTQFDLFSQLGNTLGTLPTNRTMTEQSTSTQTQPLYQQGPSRGQQAIGIGLTIASMF